MADELTDLTAGELAAVKAGCEGGVVPRLIAEVERRRAADLSIQEKAEALDRLLTSPWPQEYCPAIKALEAVRARKLVVQVLPLMQQAEEGKEPK
jgi:hypothetical protein